MTIEPLGLVSFAFLAGASAFFAPCSYPLLPGYLAYFIGESTGGEQLAAGRLWRSATVGLYVIVGFAIVFVALSTVVLVVGTQSLANIVLLEGVVGLLLVGVGTMMVLGKSMPLGYHPSLPARRRRATAYVLFGIIYAVAAAGCTAPLFLGVAGVALQGGPVTAVLGVGGYAAGMSTLMVAVTLLSALGRDALVARLATHTDRISRAAGVLLVLAGCVQLYLFVVRYGGLTRLGVA